MGDGGNEFGAIFGGGLGGGCQKVVFLSQRSDKCVESIHL